MCLLIVFFVGVQAPTVWFPQHQVILPIHEDLKLEERRREEGEGGSVRQLYINRAWQSTWESLRKRTGCPQGQRRCDSAS